MSNTVPPWQATPAVVVTRPPDTAGAEAGAQAPAAPQDDAFARALASYGAQVVLSADHPAAIAARGGAADDMTGNNEAYATAMWERAGNVAPVVSVVARDPVKDPESDAQLMLRKI
jgi:hypothetical protein